MSTIETFHGYIETTQDTLLVFEACRRSVLPRICRRLQEKERKIVRSGTVFVFDERESGIKRWTDGLVWSPSRILGNFLIYRELDKRALPGEKKAQPAEQRQRRNSTDESSAERNKERALVGSLTNSYKFKKNGLIKKTMSIVVHGVSQHLISYYTKEDVLAGKLRTPSSVPELASLEISPEFLMKQNFRIPPMIEPTFDQHGEPDSPSSTSSTSQSGHLQADRKGSQTRMPISAQASAEFAATNSMLHKPPDADQPLEMFAQRSFAEVKPGLPSYNAQPGLFTAMHLNNFGGYGQAAQSPNLAASSAINTPLPSPTPMRDFSQHIRRTPSSAFSSFPQAVSTPRAPITAFNTNFGTNMAQNQANLPGQSHSANSEYCIPISYNTNTGGNTTNNYIHGGSQWHEYQAQYAAPPTASMHPLQRSHSNVNMSSFTSNSVNANHQPSSVGATVTSNAGSNLILYSSAASSPDSATVVAINPISNVAMYHTNNAYSESSSYGGLQGLNSNQITTSDGDGSNQPPISSAFGIFNQTATSPSQSQHKKPASSGSGSSGYYGHSTMFSSHPSHLQLKSEGYTASMPSNSFMADPGLLTPRWGDF